MDLVVNAVNWVVGQALDPVKDTVLETWATTKNLGKNVQKLKMELLYVKSVLEAALTKDLENQKAMGELLQRLQNHAHQAEDVLDLLDYFRIQDELDGTDHAADDLDARRTAKAFGKRLVSELAPSSGGAAAQKRARGGTISSSASSTLPGILFPRSLQAVPVPDDDNDATAHPGEQSVPKLEFNRVEFSLNMRLIIEDLKSMREEVLKIVGGLRPSQNVAPATALSRPKTIPESIEPRIYGRDQTMNSIIHDITKGKYFGKNLTVLPILGLGGIGKTTLMQHIYQDPRVQNHFDVKIWTCVSLNFNVDKLNEDIVKSIPSVEGEKQGTTSRELIGQRLESKRFLLVLDDMWELSDEYDWKTLLLPFRKSKQNGNIILVTTRIRETARTIKTIDQPIELEGLDPEEFKKLFQAFVFGDDDQSRKNHALHAIGDKIVAKLKGSPLAAKTVGGLLRNNLTLRHWTTVLDSKVWGSVQKNNEIMPVLKLSYDHLPFHLQQCFLYCALFPEDYEFHEENLIHFWIGLDILHPDLGEETKKVEDIGLDRLNGLVSYGFFKKQETYRGTIYLMHDLLHDLAVRVASECLVIVHSNSNNRRSPEIDIGKKSVRHLSVIMDHKDERSDENFLSKFRTLKGILETENLRTLMLFGESDQRFDDCFGDLIMKANSLRVLHLSPMSRHMNPHIQFAELPHLRYLSMVMYRDKIHLPQLLSRFYHLRILNLQGSASFDLPRDLSNLTKLRHFHSNHNSEICNVGKLRFLQQLDRFEINKENKGFELKQLGNLNEIRELGIYNLEKIHTKEEAVDAGLENKVHLRKLTLGWNTGASKNERDEGGVVLEALQPDMCLENLCIIGHGNQSCPTWLGSKLSAINLQSLYIEDAYWEDLPWLGHMMDLRELRLRKMCGLIKVPSHFGSVKDQSFCNLNKLVLDNLNGLEKWDLGETCDQFPQLQVLEFWSCPKLQALPFCDPPRKDEEGKIHWFPKLQQLQIRDCPKVALLPVIPWTQTLCQAIIEGVESSSLYSLRYYSKREEFLEVIGNGESCSIDDVLVISNLSNLQHLYIHKFPEVDLKYLEMLGSLKWLSIKSPHVLVRSESKGKEVQFHFPVESLVIESEYVTGKELSKLLSYCPKLSKLDIVSCNNITWFGVEVDQEKAPSQKEITRQITSDEVEGNQNIEDGLLALPAHLSGSLHKLTIRGCPNLSLVAASGAQGWGALGGVGGLQALCSLQELEIHSCPNFLSASSLQILRLIDMRGMGTLEPLSNLTSLTQLSIEGCGEEEDLTGEGLWTLLAHGKLSKLSVSRCPKLFVGCTRELQGDQELQQLLRRSPPKLRELETDDITGFLSAPICTHLSSCLTMLSFYKNTEIERLTGVQEQDLQLLTSLQHLRFSSCHKLQCLPAGLRTFTGLKRLEIYKCPAISSLSRDDLPVSLQQLELSTSNSKELNQQCRSFTHGHPKIEVHVYVDDLSHLTVNRGQT